MRKKNKVGIVCLLLIIFLLFDISFNSVTTYVKGLEEEYEFLISDNEDFADDSVIIVLNKEASRLNKEYSIDDFKSVACESVIDLTYEATKKVVKKKQNSMVNIDNYRRVLLLKLSIQTKENVLSAIKELTKHNDVLYASPDYVIKAASTSTNDTYIDLQWGYDMIDLYDAWDYSTGSNGVLVGVADSGIDSNHPDLMGKLNGNLSRDFTSGVEIATPYPYDNDGHGTKVGGIIGAIGNNNKGVSGVNWNCSLVSLRVLDSNGSGFSSNLALAISYAESVHIPILNFSGSWYSFQYMLYDCPLNYVISTYNGLLVCAAGNDNHNNDGEYPSLPAGIDLPNIISVGAVNIDGERWEDSNYGENSVDIYAPGENVISTAKSQNCQYSNVVFPDGTKLCEMEEETIESILAYYNNHNLSWDFIVNNYDLVLDDEPSVYKKEIHYIHGHHFSYDSGTSFSAPFVSGVAALLLSIDSTLTTQQLKNAIINGSDIITIHVPGNNGLNDVQNVKRLNAYKAVKYVFSNYSIMFSLYNNSNYINYNKDILSGTTSFLDLNSFIKLNVTYAKNYEFVITAESAIEMYLYDSNLNQLSYDDISNNNNRVSFIEYLDVGFYYLRTKYTNINQMGIINTKIYSKNTQYLSIDDETDILLNTYNGITEYNYYNESGPGFYKFEIRADHIDGTTYVYPLGALKIYNDSSRSTLSIMNKYDYGDYNDWNTNQAINKYNENYIIVYLPSNGYYYLDVDVSSTNLSSLSIEISSLSIDELDLFTLSEINNDDALVFEENNYGDNLIKLNIRQAGYFGITASYDGNLSPYILVLIVKITYDENLHTYIRDEVLIEELNKNDVEASLTRVLEAGIYYIGYLNKPDNYDVTINFERIITESGSSHLVADTIDYDEYGSEVMFNNGLRGGNTLTVGFTRFIYLDSPLNVPSISRLNYYWYTSDESIATISEYGTLLARNHGTVKVMAVYKNNPSITYVREFIVLADNRTSDLIIYNTDSISYANSNQLYQIELNDYNSYFPQISLYNWIVVSSTNNYNYTISQWGTFYLNGTDTIVVEGRSSINSKLVIRLTLTITI